MESFVLFSIFCMLLEHVNILLVVVLWAVFLCHKTYYHECSTYQLLSSTGHTSLDHLDY